MWCRVAVRTDRKMSSAYYVLLPLVVALQVSTADDTVVETLFDVMMKDCRSAKGHESSSVGVSEQRVVHEMKTLESSFYRNDGEPHVYDMTAVAVLDVAYVRLGCKWADTISGVLKPLKTAKTSRSTIQDAFSDLNRITLKVESALFELAKLEPNVLTREPGALATALSLNLRLNRVNDAAGSPDVASYSRTSYEIKAAINMIERFTIGNCAVAVQPYSVKGHGNESPDLIGILDNLLDRTGLPEPDYDRYNVNDRAPSVTDDVAPKRSSVVHSVASCFCSLLGLPVDADLNFKCIDDVFRYQKQMYDRIRWIVHSNTLVYLVDLRKSKISSISDPPGNNYLDETYIEQNGLVLYYQNLLDTANILSFPPDIVDHIQLMLKLVKSVPKLKTVNGLNVYIEYEKYTKALLSANKSNVTNSSLVLEKYTPTESKRFELHTFLNDILSVEFVKYYNDIFKLSKYGFQEVQNRDEVIDGNTLPLYKSIYKHCFDIKMANEGRAIEQNILNLHFTNVFTALETLKNYISNTHETLNLTILIEADQYLKYNMKLYTVLDENVQDKLNRTIHMFTNLIDRHQMIFFEKHTLCDDAFVLFAEEYRNEKTENTAIKNPGLFWKFRIKNNVLLVNTEERLVNCVLFHVIHSVQLDIRPSVILYWKGKLKSINGILSDVSKTLFDLYSITKYVQVLIEWVTAVTSYTLLDFIKNILNGHRMSQLFTFIEEWNTYAWPEYCLVALKTVIDIMSKKFIQHDELVELQSILENNLHQYSNGIQRDVNYRVPILSTNMFVNRTKELKDLLTTILYLDNKFTNNCKIESSKNPLVFYLPEYFINV